MASLLVTHTSHFVRCRDGHVYAPNAGGALHIWRRYLSVFDRLFVAARVALSDASPDSNLRASDDVVQFIELPDYRGPWQYLNALPALRRRLANAVDQCDAVCLRVPCAIADVAWRELRRRGRPYGLEVVGDPIEALGPGTVRTVLRPIAQRVATARLRRQCSQAYATLYVTQHSLQRRYPPSAGAFTTHCSDVEIRPEAIKAEPRRYDDEAHKLVLVGTLEVLYKGPDVLIRALKRCADQHDLHVTFVGGGRCQMQLGALAESLGVASCVKFAGHHSTPDAVRAALDEADVFVLPSRADALPRALIEAMARALPCIGSRIGGIPELLTEDDLVPPGDDAVLARKILEFVKNPNRLSVASSRNLGVARTFLLSELQARREAMYRVLLDSVAGANKSRI